MQPFPVRIDRQNHWAALVFGLVHAFWNFYWAFGGVWMLDSVRQWAMGANFMNRFKSFSYC